MNIIIRLIQKIITWQIISLDEIPFWLSARIVWVEDAEDVESKLSDVSELQGNYWRWQISRRWRLKLLIPFLINRIDDWWFLGTRENCYHPYHLNGWKRRCKSNLHVQILTTVLLHFYHSFLKIRTCDLSQHDLFVIVGNWTCQTTLLEILLNYKERSIRHSSICLWASPCVKPSLLFGPALFSSTHHVTL